MTLSENTSSNLTRQSLFLVRKPIFSVYWKEEPHKMARDPLGGEIITTCYRDTPLTVAVWMFLREIMVYHCRSFL